MQVGVNDYMYRLLLDTTGEFGDFKSVDMVDVNGE